MSRNSKMAKKCQTRKDKGPRVTTAKHGKKNAWWQKGNKNVPKQGEQS